MLKLARIRSVRNFNEFYKPGDAYSAIQPGIVFISFFYINETKKQIHV